MAPSALRNWAVPVLLALGAALSLPAVRAATQPSQLCSCSDLLWRPEPTHIPEVMNVHSKYLTELSEAEAHGVRYDHPCQCCESAAAGFDMKSISTPKMPTSTRLLTFTRKQKCLARVCTVFHRESVCWQGYDVIFYGDSITMRWRDDWPGDAWGNKPLPPDTPGGTPTGVFNATFRTKYTAGIMGVGSTVPDFRL